MDKCNEIEALHLQLKTSIVAFNTFYTFDSKSSTEVRMPKTDVLDRKARISLDRCKPQHKFHWLFSRLMQKEMKEDKSNI